MATAKNFVPISRDGQTASVHRSSLRVWLDKGWKLVEEEVKDAEQALTGSEDEASSPEQPEGDPPAQAPESPTPTPAPPVKPTLAKAQASPAATGQEA